MHTITSLSKLLVIAFSITCCVVLFWQDGSPIFSINYSSSDICSETELSYQKIMTTPATSTSIAPKSNKIVDSSSQNTKIDNSTESSIKEQTSIWIKIGEQLKLNHYSQNPRVQKEMHKILADKKSFETILNRSAPYIYYIYKQTQQRHLPAELALIPIIESEYNPNDHNSIDALGLWQLMPGTAQDLGVKMDNGYDGRRNVIDSTNAALTFLSDLEKEFHGNWNLSFAAYNCGPGCVSSAVKKAKSNDYFELGLPVETKLYVPRLLAIAALIKHAQEYGIVLPQIKDAPYFTEVKVNKSENLSNYAKSTGTNLVLLKKLNPDYRFEKSGPSSKLLLVPVNSRSI